MPNDELLDAVHQAMEVDTRAREQRLTREQMEQLIGQLTLQERQVMEMVAAGDLNKVIANRLHISLRTVERDRANVFNKLQVKSVAQLVEKLLRLKR